MFLSQGEVSPGGDGDASITGEAAPAHDAEPVIVTDSAVATIAELIDFIWKKENNIKRFWFSRGIFLIFGDVTPSEFQINHEIKDRNFHE